MFAHSRYVPFCKQIARGASKAIAEMGERVVEGTTKVAGEVGEAVTGMMVEETTGGMELEGKGLLKIYLSPSLCYNMELTFLDKFIWPSSFYEIV